MYKFVLNVLLSVSTFVYGFFLSISLCLINQIGKVTGDLPYARGADGDDPELIECTTLRHGRAFNYTTGTAILVTNKNKESAASTEYYAVSLRNEETGEPTPYLFTRAALESARKRAEKNPEDVPGSMNKKCGKCADGGPCVQDTIKND